MSHLDQVHALLAAFPDSAGPDERKALMRAVADVVRDAGYQIPLDVSGWRRAEYHARAYHLRPDDILNPVDRLHRFLLEAEDWSDPEWPSAIAEILTDGGYPE